MSQLNLFENNQPEPRIVEIQNGEYIYFPTYYNLEKSDFYFNYLLKEIKWQQEKMHIYGRAINFPRLTAWYGDKDRSYTFSGITLIPNVWTSELMEIKKSIESKCSVKFNSVLLNYYRDGSDSISWHSDAEKELGKNPTIASLNFGETRIFQLRNKQSKEIIKIELVHGSLLLMQGKLQHYWQHQIPKTKRSIGGRINLTFRLIK